MDIVERIIGSLIIVAAVIWLGAYLYSRRFNLKTKGNDSLIRVLISSVIGHQKSIAVVDIAGEYLVLGMTPDSITCLTRLENPAVIEHIKKQEKAEQIKGLRDIFSKGINLSRKSVLESSHQWSLIRGLKNRGQK